MSRTSRRRDCRPATEALESRALMTTFTVTSDKGSGPGTLPAAII